MQGAEERWCVGQLGLVEVQLPCGILEALHRKNGTCRQTRREVV